MLHWTALSRGADQPPVLAVTSANPVNNPDPAAVLAKFPPDVEGTPTPVAEALKKVTMPEGFHITCFASEPQVMQPIAIQVDDRGRLWVAECYSYPEWQPIGQDRLLILEDTNGDGIHDTRKVFYQQERYLTGFVLGHGGVWVCAAPDLLFIPDRNQDDVPDGPPEIILTGWSTEGKHNVVNGLQWGPDGWLYGCNGVSSPSRVGTPDTLQKDRTPLSCGVWRYHPTRKKFEGVTHGGTNPWGIDWNAEGDLFYTNCVIGHLYQALPGAHYIRMHGQDVNPYSYDLMPATSDHFHWQGGDWTRARGQDEHDDLGGGHAHSGAVFLLGDRWPQEYRGDLLMCNIHGLRINRDRLERTATGYVGRHRPDLIKFNDPWFRGVCLATGPDGSIYVADWCDIGECHDYKDVHRNSGRIYKFWHGELKKWQPADLEALVADPTKVDAVADPWSARRVLRRTYEADLQQRKILAENAFPQILVDKFKTLPVPQLLYQLWYWRALLESEQDRKFLDLLGTMISPSNALTGHVYADPVRKTALAVYCDLLGNTQEANSLTASFFAEVDPAGSLVLAYLGNLHNAPVTERKAVLAAIFKNPLWQKLPQVEKERDYAAWADRRNLQLMTWYALEAAVGADPQWAVEQLPKLPDPLLVRLTIRRLTDQSDDAQLAKNLEAIFGTPSLWQDESQAYDFLAALQAGLAGREKLSLSKNWTKLAPELRKHTDGRVRLQAIELSLLMGDPKIGTVLLENLANEKLSTPERARAMQLMARRKVPELAPQLEKLLDDPALRKEALAALAAYNLETTPDWVLARFARLTPPEKLVAVETLASRPHWAGRLIDALEQKTIARADLPAYVARQIELFKQPQLTKKLREIWGNVRATPEAITKRKAELMAELTAERLAASDYVAGGKLFRENCAQCHKLLGEGGNVGPELTGAQRGDLNYLLDNILDPSAVVPKDLQMTVLTLNDGRVLTGVVAEQSQLAYRLRNAQGEHLVSRGEIDEEQRLGISLMPDGLLGVLTTDQIRDLIGYLQHPEKGN
ncbi:MAG: c-type cytochrome [Pirellulales bacterium]|nr:c-type cytochrome [Pirellulales bacterium]